MVTCRSKWGQYECVLSPGHKGLHQTEGRFTVWNDGASNGVIDVPAVTGETITDEQIRELYTFGRISHATWINGIVHPTTRLGQHARRECAEIVNALSTGASETCSRCRVPVHRSWDHLSIGEHGEHYTCDATARRASEGK